MTSPTSEAVAPLPSREALEVFMTLLENHTPMDITQTQSGMQTLHEMGWRRDTVTEVELPEWLQRQGYKKTHFPWWLGPNGERIRGLKSVVKKLLSTPAEPPSEMASRLMEALEKHPGLKREVRDLLNSKPRTHLKES